MAAVVCLACCDITSRASKRRNLSSSSSSHVVPLWKEIVQEEIQKQDRNIDIDSVVDPDRSGYMCRKCFYAYEKYMKLKESLSSKARLAIDSIFPQSSSQIPCIKRSTFSLPPPPSKRVSISKSMPLATSSSSKTDSPEFVSVSCCQFVHE